METTDGMTYRIIATKGDRVEHVGRLCLGGIIGPDFGDRENAEMYAAVWAAANPGWEWRVELCKPPYTE